MAMTPYIIRWILSKLIPHPNSPRLIKLASTTKMTRQIVRVSMITFTKLIRRLVFRLFGVRFAKNEDLMKGGVDHIHGGNNPEFRNERKQENVEYVDLKEDQQDLLS